MEAIDLTMRIEDGTPVYPGDPETTVRDAATVEEEGYAVKRLSFSSHVSTHVDAPAHVVDGGRTVDEYPPERFVGEAVVVDVRGRSTIDPDLSDVDAEVVLFWTGHAEEAYGEDAYHDDHPVIAEGTARELVETEVSAVGMDSPSPDVAPYPVHDILLGNDVLVVENLVGVGDVGKDPFRCYVMPLRIKDGDGAPCRVIAEVG